MDHGSTHNMSGMSSASINNTNMHTHKKMMMHMTFYWGDYGYILFNGWPGTRPGMYALALLFVFVLAVLVEWLSHCQLIKKGSNTIVAGCIQTLMHAIRMGLAYILMLALMSFNGGVFLAAILGHAVGFFAFGSRAFKTTEMSLPFEKHYDLPPMSC